MNPQRIALAASLMAALSIAGCKGGINGDTTSQESAEVQYPSQDPASANLAPVSNASDNTGAPPGAYRLSRPHARGNNSESEDQYSADEQDQDPYADQYSSGSNYDDYSDYDTPVNYAPDPPPPLPDYEQPPAPGDDYIWTPGCWNYDGGQGYYWVPGAWVLAPYNGALWTPGWWGYDKGQYGWHRGFWGRHVGYYGGINYGHGYDGRGYEGGYWQGDHFSYNRSVNNINTTIVKNVYVYKVTNITNTRVSYNGGRGGVTAQPRPREIAAYHEQHNPPMSTQTQMAQQARSDRQNFAHVNNGRPGVPVAAHPLQADSGVRPPTVLHQQAMRQPSPEQRPQSPVENRPQSPAEFQNNMHPEPAGGSHFAPQNPPPQNTRPEAPRDNHQPAPGRPMLQHPAEPPQPERPAPQQREAPPQERRSQPAPQRPQPQHPSQERKPGERPQR